MASNPYMDKYTKLGNNFALECTYSKAQLDLAEKKGRELGLLKNSITKGKSNVWGMLGEIVVAEFTKSKIVNNRHYDLLTQDGKKIEVKTKKTKLKHKPKPHFECSVCDHNSKQQCDYYVFVRVSTTCNKAWICGQISRKQFFKVARFFKKGDTDPRNNYKVHASCWNISISELCAIGKLKVPPNKCKSKSPAAKTEEGQQGKHKGQAGNCRRELAP